MAAPPGHGSDLGQIKTVFVDERLLFGLVFRLGALDGIADQLDRFLCLALTLDLDPFARLQVFVVLKEVLDLLQHNRADIAK